MKRALPLLALAAAFLAFVLARRVLPRDAREVRAVSPALSGPAILPDPTLAALLWVRPRDASPGSSERSLWLAPDGHLLRDEPGLFFLRGDTPARLSTETRSVPLPPCPRGHTPFPARTTQRTLLHLEEPHPASGPSLGVSSPSPSMGRGQGVRSPSEVEMIPFTGHTALLVEELHHPLAALDDTLFFCVDRVENPCEEQPRYTASFLVLRVGSSGVKKIHTDPILASGLARSQAAARLGARLGPSVRVAAADLRPTMVLPFFTGEGADWSVQLTARVPWELSFGGWGSETASELIVGSEAPPWSTSRAVPAAALRHAREHPEEIVIGVQRFPAAQ